MKKGRVFILSCIMLMMISAVAAAQEKSIEDVKELTKMSLDELLNMDISVATKTKMSMDEAPSVVSVITEHQIKQSGAKTFMEVLKQVAGFHVYTSTTYPDGIIGIRGLGEMDNSSVKLMVNGHSLELPVFSIRHRVFTFPVNLIKKIEIIRGPGSALYGNSAMNGVVNVITKDAGEPSSVSVGYGSFETVAGTGHLSYAKDDFSLFFFADAVKTDGDPQLIESDAATLRYPPGSSLTPGYSNEDFQTHSFFSRLAYKNFYLTGLYSGGSIENPIGVASILTDDNDIRNKNFFAEAGYDGPLTDQVKLTAKAYYDYLKSDPVYEGFSQKITSLFNFPEGEGTYANPVLSVEKIGADVMLVFSPVTSLDVAAGVSWEYSENGGLKYILNSNSIGKPMSINGVTYPMFGYFNTLIDVSGDYPWIESNVDRTIYAGYFQGTWNIMKAFPSVKGIGNNLTITAGLRYDNYDDVGDTLNPRIGIVYGPSEKLFFKLLYGKAFRAPLFNEMYTQNNPVQIGNPDMDPETITTVEFLAGVHLTERITATLNFFNIRKEDTIRLYRGVWSNWGEIESKGIEGEIRVSYDKNKYGYFNLTWQKAEDTTHELITDVGGAVYEHDDYNLGMYPELMANIGVNYDVTRNINANVSVNYIGSIDRIGKMRFTPAVTDPDGTVEKTDQRDSVDSYALVNLSLTFGNFDFAKGWEFQVTGFNIFDADHRDPEKDGAVLNDLPRWDRHFMGKLTYSF